MHYVGFDLGTTNSAAAVFDGEDLTLVRSAMGGHLTPSVVRYNSKGIGSVGSRARRFLERDPDNTRAEFKRLMGTDQRLHFAAADLHKTPQELSAEVLRSLCADVEEQLGLRPSQAVITVPALFEIPQSAATAEAGRLAGLDRVELLQEPVASALAAGWNAEASRGSWLVYDLGGGTFDVSLLESREGLLRVVGHGGDNFLGGRDFDRALVDWLAAQISDGAGIAIERRRPEHQSLLRQLALLAEEAKIDLTRSRRTEVSLLGEHSVDGRPLELDLVLERSTLEELCLPLVDRSIDLCLQLLEQHGLSRDELETVVLVGGPTVMPLVRRRITERLGRPAGDHLDPMALVAQGGALYAASAGLEACPTATASPSLPGEGDQADPSSQGQGTEGSRPHQLWLQYPAMASTFNTHLIGRLAQPGDGPPPSAITIHRQGDEAEAAVTAAIEAENSFIAEVELKPRQINIFSLSGHDAEGHGVAVTPETVSIVHGVTLSDPPLSRTLGVALADNRVKVYFERGVPLPARRMFRHRTLQPLIAGQPEQALTIPIVQGEFEQAHLCRLVGTLQIPAADLERSLDASSPVEITLELDRGGHLAAKALVPELGQVFENVAQLIMPAADITALGQQVETLQSRLVALHRKTREPSDLQVLGSLDRRLMHGHQLLEAGRGGDEDAAQQALRELLDIESKICDLEDAGRWSELEQDALFEVTTYGQTVNLHGSAAERDLLQQLMAGVERARKSRSPQLLSQQMRAVRRLGSSVYYRQDSAWPQELDWIESQIDQCQDVAKAQRLIADGRRADSGGDLTGVQRAVRGLWELLPATAEERRRGHFSDIH